MISDLLLSIALWGGVALCFVAASNFNWFLYVRFINQGAKND